MTNWTERLLEAIDRLTSHGDSPNGPGHRLILTVDVDELERLAAEARADLAQPEQPVSERRPVWTEGICGDGAAILKDGVMQPIEDVIAALNAASLAQPPASWWRSAGPTNYSEDFWRRDALEKLVHAATSFRVGVYSAEELEIYENRARAILARWGHPAAPPETLGRQHGAAANSKPTPNFDQIRSSAPAVGLRKMLARVRNEGSSLRGYAATDVIIVVADWLEQQQDVPIGRSADYFAAMLRQEAEQ